MVSDSRCQTPLRFVHVHGADPRGGTVVSRAGGADGIRLTIEAPATAAGAQARRLDRDRRCLPDRRRGRQGRAGVRRRPGDARPHDPRNPRPRVEGQPRARAACRGSTRRALRPGPRRRRRQRALRRVRGRREADLVRRAGRAAPLRRREGVDRGAGDEPDRRRGRPKGFAVALIPHTLAATTLGALEPEDPVNLEGDVLAKYVEKLLPR